MNIELKNVKHIKSMSQETPCFTATLYIDGKSYGECGNRGHGGPNEASTAAYSKLNAYAKTLSPKPGYTFPQDSDSLISDAFEAYDLRKTFDSQIKTCILALNANNKIMKSNKLPAAQLAGFFKDAKQMASFGAKTFLNTLPADEAFALYKAHVYG